MSEHCQFGQTLSDALCDQFVPGLHNDQKKLLSVSALTFKKDVEVAIAIETTEKDSLEFSVSQDLHERSETKGKIGIHSRRKEREEVIYRGNLTNILDICTLMQKVWAIYRKNW